MGKVCGRLSLLALKGAGHCWHLGASHQTGAMSPKTAALGHDPGHQVSKVLQLFRKETCELAVSLKLVLHKVLM